MLTLSGGGGEERTGEERRRGEEERRRGGEKDRERGGEEDRREGEEVRWLSGDGVGLVIRRLLDQFPAMPKDVVSLDKALHPTCLRRNVPVLTVSRSG